MGNLICGGGAIQKADYADPANWYARESGGSKKADCFYVHPTTEMGVTSWNISREKSNPGECGNCKIRDNTSGDPDLLENQAGAFKQCCNIWAPRYSQVGMLSLAADWENPKPAAMEAWNIAVTDVRMAFQYFLANRPDKNRPFVIAGHSQGSIIMVKVIKDCLDGKPEERQFVAAYLAGGYVYKDLFGTVFKGAIHECRGPTDKQCIISWDTRINEIWKDDSMKIAQLYYQQFDKYCEKPIGNSVCLKPRIQISPISWTDKDANGTYMGVKEAGRAEPLMPPRGWGGFRVTPDAVWLDDPRSFMKFGMMIPVAAGNLHPKDFHMWYFNVNENVAMRLAAFR